MLNFQITFDVSGQIAFEDVQKLADDVRQACRPPMPDDPDQRINWRGWIPRGSESFARSPSCELRPRFAVGLGIHDAARFGER